MLESAPPQLSRRRSQQREDSRRKHTRCRIRLECAPTTTRMTASCRRTAQGAASSIRAWSRPWVDCEQRRAPHRDPTQLQQRDEAKRAQRARRRRQSGVHGRGAAGVGPQPVAVCGARLGRIPRQAPPCTTNCDPMPMLSGKRPSRPRSRTIRAFIQHGHPDCSTATTTPTKGPATLPRPDPNQRACER